MYTSIPIHIFDWLSQDLSTCLPTVAIHLPAYLPMHLLVNLSTVRLSQWSAHALDAVSQPRLSQQVLGQRKGRGAGTESNRCDQKAGESGKKHVWRSMAAKPAERYKKHGIVIHGAIRGLQQGALHAHGDRCRCQLANVDPSTLRDLSSSIRIGILKPVWVHAHRYVTRVHGHKWFACGVGVAYPLSLL